MDFGDKTVAKLTMTFPDAARAKTASETIQKGLDKAELFIKYVSDAATQHQGDPDLSGMVLPLAHLREAFKNAKVEQQGGEVRVLITANLTTDDYLALIRGVAHGLVGERLKEKTEK